MTAPALLGEVPDIAVDALQAQHRTAPHRFPMRTPTPKTYERARGGQAGFSDTIRWARIQPVWSQAGYRLRST